MKKKEDNPQDLPPEIPDEDIGDKLPESPQKETPIVIDGVEYTQENIQELLRTKKNKETELEQRIQEVETLKAKTAEKTLPEEDIFANKEKLAEAMYDDPQGTLDKHRQKIEKDMEAKFNSQLESAISPLLQNVREDQKARLREKYPGFDKDKEKEVDKIFQLLRPDIMRNYLAKQGYANIQSFSDYELAYHLHNFASGILPGGSVATFSEPAKRRTGTPPSTEEKLADKGYKPEEIDIIKSACKKAGMTLEEYLASKENPEKGYDDK